VFVQSRFLNRLYKLYNFVEPMVTTKIRSDFARNIVNSLLFFSMQKPAEMYLSEEIKNKSKTSNRGIRNLKVTITSSIDKKIWNLFRKNTYDGKSLDNEIEIAMGNIKDPEQENLNSILANEENSCFLPGVVGYSSKKKTSKDAIKSALKDLYGTFVSYGKSVYGHVSASVGYAKRKIIEGPVRMTLAKFVKVFEYILAVLNPQWNMPTLSKKDYDTLAMAVTNHVVINKENFQYESGHSALMYRH